MDAVHFPTAWKVDAPPIFKPKTGLKIQAQWWCPTVSKITNPLLRDMSLANHSLHWHAGELQQKLCQESSQSKSTPTKKLVSMDKTYSCSHDLLTSYYNMEKNPSMLILWHIGLKNLLFLLLLFLLISISRILGDNNVGHNSRQYILCFWQNLSKLCCSDFAFRAGFQFM